MPEHAAAPAAVDRRIPVIILTGFLGVGKTTLLNHLLAGTALNNSAVLINEFGEVGLDHLLVDKIDETLLLLDSGCICCSVQGDLVRALKNLFTRAARREIGPLERVLIETTGLADPAPVIHTLMQESFIAERYRCDGVVTAVDATLGEAQLEHHREAMRQVVMADRLLLTKCDLADDARRVALHARLAALNPGAERIEVSGGRAPAAALAPCGLYDAGGKMPDVARWLGEEAVLAEAARRAAAVAPVAWRKPDGAAAPARKPDRHDASVKTYTLRFDAPLDWLAFCDALEILLQVHGARILRIKGLLDIAGDPLPRVVQCVQHIAYPPSSLPAWPEAGPFADRHSRLVCIVHDLPREDVASLLGAVIGQMPG